MNGAHSNPPLEAKLTQAAAWATLAMAMLGVLVIGWLLLYPPGTATTIEEFSVSDGEVVAGSIVPVEIGYCSDYSGPIEATITIEVGSTAIFTPITRLNRPVGCDNLRVQVAVPRGTPAGTATFTLDVYRTYNPLRQEVVSAEADPVEILRPPDGG